MINTGKKKISNAVDVFGMNKKAAAEKSMAHHDLQPRVSAGLLNGIWRYQRLGRRRPQRNGLPPLVRYVAGTMRLVYWMVKLIVIILNIVSFTESF
ncbi:MAG: hypothetical protein CXZ00_14300 [Acidobacteria bacterium]|nr:MAG: hypothetical protein CXZ00_14300 [Acidobacteriota bacterium]